MGNDLRIEIDRSQTGGTFTNYDFITGTVKLTNTSSLTLNYIQVKLEGLSQSQMVVETYKDDRQDRKEYRTLQDVHKLLYDTLVVFPPDNVRAVSRAKEFTLTPGTYIYPFLFKIPLKNSCSKSSDHSETLFPNVRRLDFNIGGLRLDLNNFVSSFNLVHLNNPSVKHHEHSQLPPSVLSMGHSARVTYFVKATCKRASFFKANLRDIDPFKFLPLDLDDQFKPIRLLEEEYDEVYYRKDVVFKNRIPEVADIGMDHTTSSKPSLSTPLGSKKGLLSSIFSPISPPVSPEEHSGTSSRRTIEISKQDVNFAFEVRFCGPEYLSPTESPRFKLFLVSNVDPSIYSLAKDGKPQKSNGLGVVYLHRLKFDLVSTTGILVTNKDGQKTEFHHSRIDKVYSICNNTYLDLVLDLKDSKRQKSSSTSSNGLKGLNAYELEIPKNYYQNFQLPRDLAPSFKTCNIYRSYDLVISADVSDERLCGRSSDSKIIFVELLCSNVKVLSGFKLTQTLNSNATNPSVGASFGNSDDSGLEKVHRLLVPGNQLEIERAYEHPVERVNVPLPTYQDVVRESSNQDDSEHIHARER